MFSSAAAWSRAARLRIFYDRTWCARRISVSSALAASLQLRALRFPRREAAIVQTIPVQPRRDTMPVEFDFDLGAARRDGFAAQLTRGAGPGSAEHAIRPLARQPATRDGFARLLAQRGLVGHQDSPGHAKAPHPPPSRSSPRDCAHREWPVNMCT